MTDNGKFDMHCIVELFGHSQIAGKVTEQSIGGATFLRVDVPKTSRRDSFTKFYGAGAIYAITPVEEKVAFAMAEAFAVEPVSEYRLRNVLDKPALPSLVLREDFDSSYEAPERDEFEDEEEDIEHDGSGEPNALADKLKSARWARELLKGEFVIFDTETTGFEQSDEIVQIGVVDQAGEVVLERLIKPTQPISNSQYHGLTDDLVKDAPGFPAVYEQINAALSGKTVLAYNAEYDIRMLNQVCQRHGLNPILFSGGCVMEQYAQFNGEWNAYHGNYRWKKLREALAAFGLKHEDFGTKEHDACTDARATLAVLKKMAEFGAEKPSEQESKT